MQQLNFYTSLGLKNDGDVFKHLVDTFLLNNRTWEYYVNWKKIFANKSKYEVELNILNSLCGAKDFQKELRNILKEHPSVVKVFPILLGVRGNRIDILDSMLPEFVFRKFNFEERVLADEEIESLVLFFEKSGLQKMIAEGKITDLKNYIAGVEVGLDTNSRKNRSGAIAEDLVDNLLQKVYSLNEANYVRQGTRAKVRKLWRVNLPIDKASRRPDFVVYKNNKLYWIEVNFYSGGGSKLKSTCGEYEILHNFCKSNGVEFIWITDGKGWEEAEKSLEGVFLHNDYIFNLNMVKDGVLHDLWN